MKETFAVVTGANQGIGKATALGLAQAGARVAMVCRSRERGEAARVEIVRATRNEHVTLHVADLGVLGRVRTLADELSAAYASIDVLINNAAIVPRTREESPDGFEMQWAVNHLAPFLLTDLLLPKLLEGDHARIVIVASDAHRGARVHFDDLQSERRYSTWRAYAQTKVANVLFTYALARRLDGTAITANCLHPGVITTTLVRGLIPSVPWLDPLIDLVLASPASGARTGLFLALSPSVDGVSGKYFKRRRPIRSSRYTYDVDLQERLWSLSVQQTGAPDHASRLPVSGS